VLVEVDLLPFLVEALGHNRKIRDSLDELYQSDKFRFYELARNHELYDHPIVKEGGLLQEEYSKKALGILLAAGEDEVVFSSLLQVLEVGWKEIYSFVSSRPSFSLRSLMRLVVRKFGPPSALSSDFTTSCFVVALSVSNLLGKQVVQDEDLSAILQHLADRWAFYGSSHSRMSLDRVLQNELEEIDSLVGSLGQVYNLDSFLDHHLHIGEVPAFLFDFEGLSSHSIFDGIEFSQKDLEEIALCYLAGRDVLERSSPFIRSFTFMFYIRYLLKAYKQVKEHYFANNKETMFMDFQRVEKEKDDLFRRLGYTQQLLDQANDTIDSLNREIKRLELKIRDLEAGRAELNSLREYVFSLDQEVAFDPVEGKVDLSQVKAVVLGGPPRWQNRMKALLPHFSFIPPESVNFDQNIVRNADFLFVYVNFLNHKIYYRAMSAVTSARVHFLRQSNEELVLEEIKKVVKG